MKQEKTLQKLGPLLKAPSFTSKEARANGVSSATLAYYVKKGNLLRIGHGVYRGAQAPTTADFRWEDLVEAAQRVKGGVICLTSALALYGLTDEIPRAHWIAIRNETMHRSQGQTKVIRMRNLKLGKTTIDIGGVVMPIFDRERTIVDSFRYLGSEAAIKALRAALKAKGTEKIEIEKLRRYAKALRVKIDPYILAITT